MELTRFGAQVDTPARTGAVLRGFAVRIGLELHPVADVDLAAAVVAADALLEVTGLPNLDALGVANRGTRTVLAALLSRAAGVEVDTDRLIPAVPTEASLRHAELAWRLVPDQADEALRRAASDFIADLNGPLTDMARRLIVSIDVPPPSALREPPR